MGRIAAVILALLLTVSATEAAKKHQAGMRLWNLTLHTLTSVQFSPAGQNDWGPNQCENDSDKTVDHDERLRITGIEPGRYDAKLADKTGRICVVKDLVLKEGIFAIEEKQLTNCEPK